MSSNLNTFTLLFRGELVRQFTSVHDVQAVRLGYRKHLDGSVSYRPEVLRQMKTVAALKRTTDAPSWNQWKGQSFIIVVQPGTTEITDIDAEIVSA